MVFGGYPTVATGANGRYSVPFPTSIYASVGSVWAGDYTGTDTGDPATAYEYFWNKFAYVPTVNFFTGNPASPPVTTQDLALEPFDPAVNPGRVASLKTSHDTSALTGFTFGVDSISLSVPYFVNAVHSSPLELGQYYDFSAGPRDLRVFKIPSGAQSQQIRVENTAFNFATFAYSNAWYWRDGTNLESSVSAKFLGVPSLQSPAEGGGVGRNPTLSWKAVVGAKLYIVSVVNAATGRLAWEGYTPHASITLPVTLAANTQYVWGVYTDDQTEVIYYFSSDPLAREAAHWLNLAHYPKLKKAQGNRINAWRGELARYFLQTQGAVPQRAFGRGATYQNLLANGFRQSGSEEFSFTTGN